MPARKKTAKEQPHQPTLFEKIGGQAIHISHEIAAGTGHLLEAAGEKFSAVKEGIINTIGKRVPEETKPKRAAEKKTVKKVVKKAAKKVVAKAKKIAKPVKKKAVVKKAAKKVAKKKIGSKGKAKPL